MTEDRVYSRALGGSRRALVYTPPGFRPGHAYPVAVFPFGAGVPPNRPTIPTPRPLEPDVHPRRLDDLAARGVIEPIVAVFLESRRVGDSREHSSAMSVFLSREVPAWVSSKYRVAGDASGRAILAVSAGAKDALEAAAAAPRAYGRLGLLIPGRRVAREPDLVARAAAVPHRLRVAILAGRYDYANLPTAHGLREALVGRGHQVEFIEVPEGHTSSTWRNHLPEVLAALFPARTGPSQR